MNKELTICIVIILQLSLSFSGCFEDGDDEDTENDEITYWTCNADIEPATVKGSNHGEEPCLIQTNNGSYMVAYSNEQIHVSKSHDGINWSTPIKVTNESGHPNIWALFPNLIQLSSGTFMIAYARSGFAPGMWVTFSDNGTNWSEPVPVEETSISPLTSHSMTQLDSGEIIIMNYDGVYESLDGIEWNKISDYEKVDYLCLIQRNDGSLMAIGTEHDWDNNYSRMTVITSGNGIDWSEVAYNLAGFSQPSLVQLRNGSYICAGTKYFQSGSIVHSETFFHFSNDGMNWDLTVQFSNYTDLGDYSMIQRDDGDYMVAYSERLNGNIGSLKIICFSDEDLKDLEGPITRE